MHQVADTQPELVSQPVCHHQAIVIKAADLAVALIDDAGQLRVPGQTPNRAALIAVAVYEAHGHVTTRLNRRDARQARHFMAGAVVRGINHPDDHIAAHANVELRIDDVVDGVSEEVAHHDDGHRCRHTAYRQCCAKRPPLHVAQDHAQRRADACDAQTLGYCAPVMPGCCRPHRFSRCQPYRRQDRVQRAEHSGCHRDADADDQQPRRNSVLEIWKVKRLGVQAGEKRAQPVSERHAEHQA